MGQQEVYTWLKNQYESGNLKYFCTREIEQGLKTCCSNGQLKGLRGDLIRLWRFGYIDMVDLDKTGINNYNRVFRYKNGHEKR